MSDFATDVRLIAEAVLDLCIPHVTDLDDVPIGDVLAWRSVLRDAIAAIRAKADELDTTIGRKLGPDAQIIPGIGKVKRHPRVSRRNWRSDDLRRMVMDSRVVDPETGEVLDAVANLIAVYGCAGYQAKIGELIKRRIDADEYAETEFLGWNLEVRG